MVIDTLLETDFIAKNGNTGDGGASAHLVRSSATGEMTV